MFSKQGNVEDVNRSARSLLYVISQKVTAGTEGTEIVVRIAGMGGGVEI
jgi:hypothetical protein